MSLTEPARHQLHQRLEEVLGPDEAETLMAHLPPFSWSELATKDDLARQTDRIEARLDGKIDNAVSRLDNKIDNAVTRLDNKIEATTVRLDHRIDTLEARMTARFDQIDGRFDQIDGRFEQAEALMNSRIAQLGSELRMEMANMSSEFHSTMRTNAYLILGGVSALVVAMSTITQFA